MPTARATSSRWAGGSDGFFSATIAVARSTASSSRSDRLARTGPQHPAVGPEHRPEGDVLGAGLALPEPPGQLGRREHHGQVL
jgi:hypothetical protein